MQAIRGRLARYTTISLGLAVVNSLVFFLWTVSGLSGTSAAVVTFVLMLPIAFESQRRLVWQGQHSTRTYMSFVITSLLTLGFAYACLAIAGGLTTSPVVLLAVYVLAYSTTFLAKYLAYGLVVFR